MGWIGASSTRLRLRGTFIDCVDDQEVCLSPRAQSEPGATAYYSSIFELEQQYVEQLDEGTAQWWAKERFLEENKALWRQWKSCPLGEVRKRSPGRSRRSANQGISGGTQKEHDSRSPVRKGIKEADLRLRSTSPWGASSDSSRGRADPWDDRSPARAGVVANVNASPTAAVRWESANDPAQAQWIAWDTRSIGWDSKEDKASSVCSDGGSVRRCSSLRDQTSGSPKRNRNKNGFSAVTRIDSNRSSEPSDAGAWRLQEGGHHTPEFHSSEQQQALRRKMRASVLQMSSQWGDERRLSTAMAAIEEIPQRVGEDMHKVASLVIDNVQTEIASIRTLIRDGDTSSVTAERVVQNLEVIPTMVLNLLEARVQKAKDTVRLRVRGMIQNLGAIQEESSSNTRLVEQMRMISTEVERIAGEAVEAAAMECRAHATRQMDYALAALREPGCSSSSGSLQNRAEAIHESNTRESPKLTGLVSNANASWLRQSREERWTSGQQVCALAHHSLDEAVAWVQDGGVPQSATNEVVADELLRAKVQRNARPPDMNLSPQQMQTNPGSVGHPDLCPRPCIYFSSGNCTNGNDCTFCHMPHPKRPVRLDKRHRQELQKMPFPQMLEMVWPILADKVKGLGIREDEAPAAEASSTNQGVQARTTLELAPLLLPTTAVQGRQSPLQEQGGSPCGSSPASGLGPMPSDICGPQEVGLYDQQAQQDILDLLERLLKTTTSRGQGLSPVAGDNPGSSAAGARNRRLTNYVSSAASTNSTEDGSIRGGRRRGKEYFLGALQVMGLRTLLAMLRRLAPSNAEEERQVIDQVLQKLHDKGDGRDTLQASSAVSDETWSVLGATTQAASTVCQLPPPLVGGPSNSTLTQDQCLGEQLQEDLGRLVLRHRVRGVKKKGDPLHRDPRFATS